MNFSFHVKSILSILLLSLSPLLWSKAPVKDDAIKLVKFTVEQLKSNVEATITRINQKDAEFIIAELDTLYVFVYDEDMNMIAHPVKPQNVGKCWKGKKDAAGVAFRDSIQTKALGNGSGWQIYTYQNPSNGGLKFAQKTTYFESVNCNGKKYIVCVGIYAQ